MTRTRNDRRWTVAPALGLAVVVGLSAATAAAAQQPGGRYRVLVPSLEAQGGAKDNFGKDVAEEVRKQIDGLDTHAPVEQRAFRDALRKFKLKESELDCVKTRQLAVQINAELVMCGSYEPAGDGMQVAARFVGARSGDTFEVEAFTASRPQEAAQEIFSAFEGFINHLRYTANCVEYLGSAQPENALGNCNRALEINPQSITALYSKARALMELDSLEASMQIHKQVLELNEVHADAMLTAGILATKLNNQEEALSYFRQYLELNPGNVDVRLKIATDLANEGDPAGALLLVEEGLAQDSAHETMLEYAGHFALAAAQRLEQGQGANGGGEPPEEALALFEKALGYYEKVFASKGEEADATMLRNMMATLVQLERTEQAAELGSRIVAAKPGEASLWSVYADALQKTGRVDEALAALDSVLSKNPDYEQPVFSRRGLWQVQSGQLDPARESFQRALERSEMDSDNLARAVFSYAYNEKFRKDQRDAAMPFFELARELATNPATTGMINYFSGFVFFQRGVAAQEPTTLESARRSLPMFQRALQLFEGARPFAETDPSIANNLNQAISNTNRYIEIQEALIKRGR